jgi:2-polyprenyl-3-methyl-5-hydroxy-6-metoxy-1,4-benzoquinol methylase
MNIERLKTLYQNISKHSNYQILPDCLKEHIDTKDLTINSRFEEERMHFLKSHIDFTDKIVVDIGGNTGYFSFQSIQEGASQVNYFEGNQEHAAFVKFAANDLQLNINVFNKYLNFDDTSVLPDDVNIILLFNVIHHLGDDFGDNTITKENAKKRMAESINFFYDKTDYLILQMGFCWKGNPLLPLFENGTKEEMIDFVKNSTNEKWEIQKIGIAEEIKGTTSYNLLNDENIKRNDSLGEFRNRPIFILKKKTTNFNRNEELIFLDNLVPDYKDESPYSKIKKDIIINLVKSNLTDNITDKLALQLGCSNGYETFQLSQLFKNFTVADGSIKFINKVKSLNPSVNFIHTLFEEIDSSILNQKFDFIFCHYVLEHVFDSALILKKLKNLLSANGLIFIVVPNSYALSRQIALKMDLLKNLTDLTKNDITHGHRRVYSYNSLLNDISQAGLVVDKIQGIIFKILADFQLNELLNSGFLTEKHILALQELAQDKNNLEFSDSYFVILKESYE